MGEEALATSPSTALSSALEAATLPEGRDVVVSIGMDVVSVPKVDRLVSKGGPAFLDRGWTPIECADTDNDPERLATRWAAKEAVMKCLGLGISELDPRDIEITTSESGAPKVALRGPAAERAQSLGISKLHVSASHECGWAAAIAVASEWSGQSDPKAPHQRKDRS